ncbi:Thivi_2564 family membrane protein [Oceanibium sediminis]|uniref:Thivi_2564 family membrane protein n=1 Tax=Oceanibium sediminis TaxID=2026339 RepID=UPI000DD32103|nr:Thivi_2564 family membrane protein [Oceanibium sediminis]
MPVVSFVVPLIVVGVLLWLVNPHIPEDRKILKSLNVVVVIGVVPWLLQVFGIMGPMGSIRIGA